jgi:hypothetical protein
VSDGVGRTARMPGGRGVVVGPTMEEDTMSEIEQQQRRSYGVKE